LSKRFTYSVSFILFSLFKIFWHHILLLRFFIHLDSRRFGYQDSIFSRILRHRFPRPRFPFSLFNVLPSQRFTYSVSSLFCFCSVQYIRFWRHILLLSFFIHLGVSVTKIIRCFSHTLLPLRISASPRPTSTTTVHDKSSVHPVHARIKFYLLLRLSSRFISALVSTFSFHVSLSFFGCWLLPPVDRVFVPRFVGCRQLLLDFAPVNFVYVYVYVSSLSCLSFWSTALRHANFYGMSGVYIGGLFQVSCLLLLSLGVARGTSVFGVQVTWVQVMGIFFSDCALMCGSRSQITVLEAWGPRLGGGGIGYHGLSCHGKVYEDECRIASCEVSPCEARR